MASSWFHTVALRRNQKRAVTLAGLLGLTKIQFFRRPTWEKCWAMEQPHLSLPLCRAPEASTLRTSDCEIPNSRAIREGVDCRSMSAVGAVWRPGLNGLSHA